MGAAIVILGDVFLLMLVFGRLILTDWQHPKPEKPSKPEPYDVGQAVISALALWFLFGRRK